MKLKALLLALFCTFAQAQEMQETPNLVNMMNWQGTAYPDPSIFSLCCSGGPGVAMNTSSNTLRFSYGLSTAYQMWQADSVLPGTGIRVSGFKYSWWIDNSGETRGTVSANVRFASNTGALLENYNYSYGPTNGLTQYSGTELFAAPYAISSLGQVGLAFTGKDATWWAGYYGPRVRDASLNLLYTAGTPPTPTPTPTPIPIVTTSTTTEVVVAPTETLVTETVVATPTATTMEPTVTTTTLVSSPTTTTAPTPTSAAPTSTPTKAGGPANSAAVSMVLKNNAAQQAALQSSNLATSIQQSQQAAQQDTSGTGGGSIGSDAVSLGLSSFSTAAKQMSDSMSTMDAANPTSTRNLLGMMTAKTVDTEQQEREDRMARNVASQSSSASAVGVDLGTGASLTAMAVIPQGYASYSVQLIAQTPFYAPKEIYRNQRTVDNDRVRRGLSGRSDRIHQGMVDSQYNRGN